MNDREIVEALAACDEPMADQWCALCSATADDDGPVAHGSVPHEGSCPWFLAKERVAARATGIKPDYSWASGRRIGDAKDPLPS